MENELTRKFCICISTYKRTNLLVKLLHDLSLQKIQPNYLIIIDGDPSSQSVLQMLFDGQWSNNWNIIYIPSNYANLPYQRYLGWISASNTCSEILLYFDDDIRIPDKHAIGKVLQPFWEDRNIVGVTAIAETGHISKCNGHEALLDRCSGGCLDPLIVRWFGSSRKLKPGDLSPSGHRRASVYRGIPYEPVQWLQGRVMAYRMNVLAEDCFSIDLFALYHRRYGKAEDTFLSRLVGTRGGMLIAFNAEFEHPDDDLPKAYPIQAFKLGHAIAYSRRLLNDHYRGFESPQFSDRIALVKSYIGTFLINWWRAFTQPRPHRFAFAWGYTQGALRGLIQKPTAKALTPEIDWWAEAEKAVKEMVIIQEGKS